jgi:calcineurin-like phosphoesterase family protein
MAEQWLTSDTHFGHENIIKYSNRPFKTVKEMNEALLDYWNQTVKPNDFVWHLGDVAMGHFDESWEYVKKLNGTIFLVIGNHDRIARRYHMAEKYVARFATRYLERFQATDYEMRLGDWKLHHFPYFGDHVGEERFTEFRPKDDGSILVHGHVHEEWKSRPTERMFNVGVDVRDFRPIHRETLAMEISQSTS